MDSVIRYETRSVSGRKSVKRSRSVVLTNERWNDLIKFNYKKFSKKDLSISKDDKYISASQLKNHILGTPDIDIIKRDNLNKNISDEKKYCPKTLINCGKYFEEYLYEELKSNYEFEEIDYDYDEYKKRKFDDEYIKELNYDTKRFMEQGIPIIFQGVLMNDLNRTYGIADIIIRSDYISKVIDNFDGDSEIYNGCNLSDDYHYRIIDIKYSKLDLNSNGINMKNCDDQLYYKHQVCLYTSMLEQLQGYIPNYGYVIGTKYEYNCKGNIKEPKWNMRIGKIDFKKEDIINSLLRSIVYKRDFDKNPHDYTFDNFSLRPNINIKCCFEYSYVRRMIASKFKDPSIIYKISTKERDELLIKGINSYDKIKPSKLKNKQSKMFLENKVNIPKYLKIYDKYESEYFFDYENLNGERVKMLKNIYDPQFRSDILFMIGLTFEKKCDINNILKNVKTDYEYYDDGSYQFVGFYLKDLNDERFMMKDMMNFVLRRNEILHVNKFRMFHWSQAEKRINNIVFSRMTDLKDIKLIEKFEKNCEYVDLMKEFIDNNILVKGMTKFGLKNVACAFHNNGYIKTNWNNSKYSDGLIAMLDCETMYSKGFDDKLMNEVLKYNRVDCDVLYEIVEYLRKRNHVYCK